MEAQSKLFGSPTRTRLLVAIASLKETYPSELARVLELSNLTVQRILADLEREGVIVSRMLGRNRIVSLNPRMYGAAEFESFLSKYARRTDIQQKLAGLRRRPRRAGKEI